jgi:hypothetical protein
MSKLSDFLYYVIKNKLSLMKVVYFDSNDIEQEVAFNPLDDLDKIGLCGFYLDLPSMVSRFDIADVSYLEFLDKGDKKKFDSVFKRQIATTVFRV